MPQILQKPDALQKNLTSPERLYRPSANYKAIRKAVLRNDDIIGEMPSQLLRTYRS